MTLKVAFRVDASLHIGSGHVMRCLSLGAALKSRGATCSFVCREHPGHLIEKIRDLGFGVAVLAAGNNDFQASIHEGDARVMYAQWLGCEWQVDADATCRVMQSISPDWLIVDHYALDAKWERKLRAHVGRIMVVDDLADRAHDVDLLLDQNLGHQFYHYRDLVPAPCRLLLGPKYALLRPEFAQLREYSLERRLQSPLKRLMVSMGGVDIDNATGQVLDTLHQAALADDCCITVVMGSQAPWLNNVREFAERCSWPCEVLVDVTNMAKLMADCDLAIGAAGGTSWERCCLAMPTIMVVLADNQRSGAYALAEAGGGYLLGTVRDISENIVAAIHSVARKDTYLKMVTSAATLCDGHGVERVLSCLYQVPERVRR